MLLHYSRLLPQSTLSENLTFQSLQGIESYAAAVALAASLVKHSDTMSGMAFLEWWEPAHSSCLASEAMMSSPLTFFSLVLMCLPNNTPSQCKRA